MRVEVEAGGVGQLTSSQVAVSVRGPEQSGESSEQNLSLDLTPSPHETLQSDQPAQLCQTLGTPASNNIQSDSHTGIMAGIV